MFGVILFQLLYTHAKLFLCVAVSCLGKLIKDRVAQHSMQNLRENIGSSYSSMGIIAESIAILPLASYLGEYAKIITTTLLSEGTLIQKCAVMYRSTVCSSLPNRYSSTKFNKSIQTTGISAIWSNKNDSSIGGSHGEWIPVLVILTSGGRLHIFDIPTHVAESSE
jgi:hypothetical protein